MAFRWIDRQYLWMDWIGVSGFIYRLNSSGGRARIGHG